jgi:hypothetical protein
MMRIGSVVKKVGATLFVGIIAAAAGVAAAFKKITERGDKFGKMAKRTGIAAEELQRLDHAAELTGGSIDELEKGMKRMARVIRDNERGLSTAVDAFTELGLSADALRDKSPEETLETMMGALAGIEDPLRKAALAQEVFGRAGTKLIPLLNEGADGLAKMKKEADDLGLVMSARDVANSERFRDEMTRTRGVIRGIVQAWVGKMLPAVTAGLVRFRQVINEFRQSQRFKDFGDSLKRGAVALIVALEAFAKSKEKFAFIGDIIVLGFKTGAALVGVAIREAFAKTALGRAKEAVKTTSRFLGALTTGEGLTQASQIAEAREDKTAKQIGQEFRQGLKKIFEGALGRQLDIGAEIAKLDQVLGQIGQARQEGQAAMKTGFAPLRRIGANLVRGRVGKQAGQQAQVLQQLKLGTNLARAGAKRMDDANKKALSVAQKHEQETAEIRKLAMKHWPNIGKGQGRF